MATSPETPVRSAVEPQAARPAPVEVGEVPLSPAAAERAVADQALARQVAGNASITGVARALLESFSIDDVSQRVLDAALQLTDSPRGFVGYIDPATAEFVCVAVRGQDGVPAPGTTSERRAVTPQGTWQCVLTNHRPFVVNRAEDGALAWTTSNGPVAKERFLCAPAVVGEVLLGAVAVADAPRAYEDRDVALVAEHLSVLYGLAIHRGQSEERLRRSERLASIGTLAAGIAHEINNPIGGVLLAAESAKGELAEGLDLDFVRKCLTEIIEDAKRCGRVVQSVLRFARQEPTEKWPCDVNSLVKRAAYLVRTHVERSQGRLSLELANGLTKTAANPTEMEQVLINLVHNAIEAGGPGTHVQLRTSPGAGCVRILVTDDGPGMTPRQLEHVFDPFYTTRRQSGGTGLGLSVVHGIIQAHGGRIAVTSAPHEGTVFTIELLCAD